ncbi:relaxase/mobilization nuclease domain-containing protein [Pseudomonas helleri]|uniref:relaxase/mobilization nuclease domain-containing protein n=1 Tax=Pseudomonas TaxID=286 RepID=UPI0012972841|nr:MULTISPECIES: relaxase/mobilization nuclease domain-containing protein [Pseudomonas]MQU58193.1 relaxase/mobilization nuclease domain-containing protein [Pseudomonas helleri]
MIRKKLSTQKSKGETQNTLGYGLKKSILIDSNRLQTGTTQEFIEFLAKKIDKSCKGKQENTSFHEMVSFDPSDKITPEQALAIAKELYSDTHGLNREHAFAVHTDTKQIHVHFIWAPRDFNNKIYNQVDDYRIIEDKLTELEHKHNLFKVENRKSLNPDLETNAPESSKEKALEVRGIKSHKKVFKEAIEVAYKDALTTTAFLANLHKQGFDIIPNGRNAYSLEKEGEIFKASELGIQHSKIKNKLQEQYQFSELMEHYSKKARRYNEELNLSTNEDVEFLKKNKFKTVLDKKFTHQEGGGNVEHFFKNSTSQKAFEYHKDPSKVTFQDLSKDSIKAGLQRLTNDMKNPGPLYVNGPDYAKKKMWMEFKMMNLEDKGFTLSGYKPTQQDLNELEQRKADYELQAQKWKAKKAVEEPKSVEPVIAPPVLPTPVQNAPEKPPQPTRQVAPTNDDLIDDLMKEFEPSNPTPIAEAPTEAIEPPKPDEPIASDLYTPIAPEPLPEPESDKVEGDYSTYSNDELVEAFEGIQKKLEKTLFTGNSKSDIAGHRYMDKQNLIYERKGEIKRQYNLRQDFYKMFDEISERDPTAAKQLEQAFKAHMANKRAVAFDLKPQLKK